MITEIRLTEMRFYSAGDGEEPGSKKGFYELITCENLDFQSLFLLIQTNQGLPCAIKFPILELNLFNFSSGAFALL